MELAEEENCFDIYRYLRKLRQSRKGLVDNVVSKHAEIIIISRYLYKNYIVDSCKCVTLEIFKFLLAKL